VGCKLSFGRRNYEYSLIEHILVYPGQFYSTENDAQHLGEFNPAKGALVLSWVDFEKGYQITNDNRNLGIHEFMHAMQMEAIQSGDLDSARFSKQFQKILHRLSHQDVKDKLDETRYFRAYAFTNQFEFMAVIAEYFLESPTDFKTHFPQLYGHTRKLLNYKFTGY
jgi:Mlc titration factor MtfA (ptsG expression regulator)